MNSKGFSDSHPQRHQTKAKAAPCRQIQRRAAASGTRPARVHDVVSLGDAAPLHVVVPLRIAWRSLSNAAWDEPPSSTARLHAAFIFMAFSLAVAPSSSGPPPITHLTARSSSAASTKLSRSLSTSIATATPTTDASSNAFRCCSAYSGHGTSGTPCHMLSSVEFHPQCVTKQPTAACASTSFCGARVGHTRPRPSVRSRNPAGRSSSRFASVGCREPVAGGPRSVHRKRCPLRSSPAATSCALALSNHPRLPKQRNTTDARGCASSHRTQGSFDASTAWSITGPIGYSGGARRPGTHRPAAIAARSPCSSASTVFFFSKKLLIYSSSIMVVERTLEIIKITSRTIDHLHDDAVGVHETTAVVHEPRVVRALLIAQEPRNRPRGNRRHARNVHRAVVGRFGVDCQRRQAHSEREQRGGGREVDVRGHGELAGRVDDGGGEEVYDERRGAEFRHGGPDVGRVQLHVAGLELLQVAGAVRGRVDGGEVVEPDAESTGRCRDAPDVRVDLRGGLGRRWLDNQHGDREPVSAVTEQPLAGLDERHEVARAGLREEEDVGARHCSTLSGET
ncbi:hypothetical protein ACQJBY_018116 [Aegilops geniculata]